jgi:hypothetical protein
LQLVAQDNFGQIFITDARPKRTLEIIKEKGLEAQLFLVDQGILSTMV